MSYVLEWIPSVGFLGAVLAAPYLIVRTLRRRFAERHQSKQGSVQIAPAITQ
jgi:hypothetical protein